MELHLATHFVMFHQVSSDPTLSKETLIRNFVLVVVGFPLYQLFLTYSTCVSSKQETWKIVKLSKQTQSYSKSAKCYGIWQLGAFLIHFWTPFYLIFGRKPTKFTPRSPFIGKQKKAKQKCNNKKR